MKYEYQLTLRLPETLAESLKKQALRSKRSLNAEITYILDQSINLNSSTVALATTTKLKTIIACAEAVLNNLDTKK